jgi:cell division protein FtsB
VKHKRFSRYRKILLIVIAFCFIVLTQGVFGGKGFIALMETQKEKQNLQDEIRKLETENTLLKNKINNLKSDNFEIEKKAREKLLLSKPKDLILLTPTKNDNKK